MPKKLVALISLQVDLFFLSAPADHHQPPFEQTPSQAVTRLAAGPLSTLAVGFADGTVGLWNLRGGKLLQRRRLHGAVQHLARFGRRLYVATELGDTAQLDLTGVEYPSIRPSQPEKKVRTTSDDWPFLYVRPGVFPWGYVLVLGLVLLLAAVATPLARCSSLPPRSSTRARRTAFTPAACASTAPDAAGHGLWASRRPSTW